MNLSPAQIAALNRCQRARELEPDDDDKDDDDDGDAKIDEIHDMREEE